MNNVLCDLCDKAVLTSGNSYSMFSLLTGGIKEDQSLSDKVPGECNTLSSTGERLDANSLVVLWSTFQVQ